MKFKLSKNLDLIIHDTGINIIKNPKFNNSKILDFINTDYYYQNKIFQKDARYRLLEVFDGIDISSLDNEFYQKNGKI